MWFIAKKQQHGIREAKYRLKFPSLIDLINVSMSNSSKSVRYQNWKWGLSVDILSHKLSQSKLVPSEHSGAYSLYADWRRLYKLHAVIWWARRVLVACDAFRKDSAISDEATSAWVSAWVQPEISNHSPSILNAAISTCSPPNMTNLSSPYKFGQFHWICLAVAYSGWSKATTGVCPGFNMSTDAFIMFMEWRIIATDLDCSSKSGRSAVNDDNMSFSDSRSAWKADQEKFKRPSNECSTFSWTCLSQQNSLLTSASSVGFCKRSMCVTGNRSLSSTVYSTE